jgi:SAM-dependent methyltransferase
MMDEIHAWDLQARLPIMNPTTPDRVIAAARYARLAPDDLVLDLGCGNGTVLALLAEAFGCRGIGIESRPAAAASARALMAERGYGERVEIRAGDASDPDTLPADVTVALCLGSASAFGGIEEAIGALRSCLPEDGRAVLGERSWRTERVPPEFARGLPDCATEYELLGIAREHGFALAGIVRSTEAEFDAYEAAIWAACRDRLLVDPDDLDVRKYLERIQDEYLGYGREYVGWAMYVLEGAY